MLRLSVGLSPERHLLKNPTMPLLDPRPKRRPYLLSRIRSVENLPVYQTGLPIVGATRSFKNDPFGFHIAAFRTCGAIYRTRLGIKEWVVLAGLDANDLVWRNTDLWNYGNANAAFGEQMGPDHVTQLDGERHKNRRAHLKPAFRMESIVRSVGKMDQVVAEQFSRVAERTFDLTEFLAEMIIRIASKTTLQCELSDDMIAKMDRWEREFLFGVGMGWQRHVYYRRPSYRRLKREVFDEFERILDTRIESHEPPPDDNLTAIIQANVEAGGERLRRWDLINDIYLTLLAGVHNTTNLLYWCLVYLSTQPQWLSQLQDEVQTWDGSKFRSMNQWPKLKATIQEVQRLRPGVIIHRLTAARPFEFKGYRIPAGTSILHANSLAHFLEEIYENPFEFKPDRFLEGKSYPAKASGFFGGGTHICLGMNLAMVHTPLILANLVRYYDFKFAFDPSFVVRMATGSNQVRKNVPCTLSPSGGRPRAST
jgi:sterol 14-demethylase